MKLSSTLSWRTGSRVLDGFGGFLFKARNLSLTCINSEVEVSILAMSMSQLDVK